MHRLAACYPFKFCDPVATVFGKSCDKAKSCHLKDFHLVLVDFNSLVHGHSEGMFY